MFLLSIYETNKIFNCYEKMISYQNLSNRLTLKLINIYDIIKIEFTDYLL